MLMRKLFLLLLSLICVCKVTAESVNALVLNMTTGKQVIFMLDDLPIVTFEDDELVITTPNNVVSYQDGDVVKFTYSYVDPSKVAQTTFSDTMFKFEGNVLRAYNLEPLSDVSVFSVDGSLITSAKTGANGEITLSIPQLSGNVVVVKTSLAKFKMMKP